MLQDLQKPFERQPSALTVSFQGAVSSIGFAIALGIAYFLAARLSLALLTKPDGVAVFWPAAGVAAGVLIAVGPRARWPIAVGAMGATIIANLLGDRTIWSAIVFALCNAGEALLTAGLIEYYFGSAFNLGRLRYVLGLLAAAIVATAVSGIGGTVGYVLFHHSTAPVLTIWRHWFTSDALGIVTVAPLLIGIASAMRDPPQRSEATEGLVALVTLTAMSGLLILLPREPWVTVVPIALLFPLLLWLAARCRPVFAAAAAFIFALTIVWTTTFGIGIFGDTSFPITERILTAQAGILAVALCALVLASLFAERRQHEERQNMLIAELDHRVKNVLARVAVVAMQTRQGSNSMNEFVKALDGRIQSMATAHSLLSQCRWSGVGLTDLVRDQLMPYATDSNMKIGGPNIMLSAAATQAVATVLHELVTNAAKHGALSTPDGRVSVNWDRRSGGYAAESLIMTWREIAGPLLTTPIQSGFGTSLIRGLIPHELGGSVELAFATNGVHCEIEFPLEGV
jgi:two-component sensor histidine kinase/integral membrane sensor domain MASE1